MKKRTFNESSRKMTFKSFDSMKKCKENSIVKNQRRGARKAVSLFYLLSFDKRHTSGGF